MTTTADQGRKVFQAKLDSLPDGAVLRLVPGEFPGRVVIGRALTLDGQGATLWALRGPVLSVAAAGVVLRNLRLEVTGDGHGDRPEDDCALLVRPGADVSLADVEVRGAVVGLPDEEGVFCYPLSVWLGELPHGQEHDCALRIAVPVPCEVVSHIAGLEALPRQLAPGRHEVRLHVERLPHDTLLNGSLTLDTAGLRRSILVSAHVQAAGAPVQPGGAGAVVWEPADWASLPAGAPPPRPPPRPPPPSRTLVVPGAADTATAPHTVPCPTDDSGAPLPPPDVWSLDAPATPATFVVSARPGEGSFRTLGAALQAAPAGATIQVKPGVYREALVLDREVEIVGDGAAADIVVESGDGNCLHLQTDRATVRGLTLRGVAGRGRQPRYAVHVPRGELTLEECIITSDSLACVAIHGAAAQPVLRRCRIHGGASAGVLVYDNGRGTLEDCEIAGHALAGVEVRQGGDPLLRRCQVRDGKEVGVLVHDNGRGTLEGCDVRGNALAGVAVRRGGNPTLRRCQVHDNQDVGVLVVDDGRGTLEECDVFRNAGAGILVALGGNPTVTKCRVRDGRLAGIVVARDGAGTFQECDVAGNACAGVALLDGAGPLVRACRIDRNGDVGVWATRQARGRVQECDLRGNQHGALHVEGGSVTLSQNQE